MYYALVDTIKSIFLEVVQELLEHHPKFRQDVEIRTAFGMKERNMIEIVLTAGGTSFTKLSADQSVGQLWGYPILARIKDAPGTSIEWVREDSDLQGTRDTTIVPGKYFFLIESEDSCTVSKQFSVKNHLIIEDADGETMVQFPHTDIVEGSLTVMANDPFEVFEGQSFTMDYENGILRWIDANGIPEGWDLEASYEYLDPNPVTFDIQNNWSTNQVVPGIVLAFGDRIVVRDQQVVIVQDERAVSHKVLGGSVEQSLEMTITAQSDREASQLTDYVTMMLWAQYREEIYDKYNVQIQDISIGGDSTQVRDSTAGEIEHQTSISLDLLAEWRYAIPLPRTVSVIWPYIRLDGADISEDDLKDYTATSGSSLVLIENYDPVPVETGYLCERIT